MRQTYRAIPFRDIAIDSGLSVLCSPLLPEPLPVDSTLAYMLRACRPGRALSDHAVAVAQWINTTDVATVSSSLAHMVERGWLRPCESGPASATVRMRSPRDRAPITTVGIVTADRADAFERCLDSYAALAGTHSRQLRFVVVDDSRERINIERNRCACRRVEDRLGTPVLYVGRVERRLFQESLVTLGMNRDILDFALQPSPDCHSAGANRNALLLATAGELVMSVDDDTVASTWGMDVGDGDVVHCGHEDPLVSRFFQTRADALAAVAYADLDLLGMAEAMLSADVAMEPEGLPGVVRLVSPGVAGDTGKYSPHRLLFSIGRTRELMAQDEPTFRCALSSREVVRVAPQAWASRIPRCMTYCVAMDNQGMLPPFMPAHRNHDGVFSVTLEHSDPSSLSGDLPCGIVHDASRSSAYSDAELRAATTTRISDLLIGLMAAWTPPPDSHPATRLTRLGQYLIDTSRHPAADFAFLARTALLDAKCRPVAKAYSVQIDEFPYPDYWITALDSHKDALVRALADPWFLVPLEFRRAADPAEALAEAAVYIRRFGELLTAWPQIWNTALTLRSRSGSVRAQSEPHPSRASSPTLSNGAEQPSAGRE
jgi:hypothetical protein